MKEQQIIEIEHDVLMDKVMTYKEHGFKLIQICATKIEAGFELSYSFAIIDDFQTLRIHISEETVMSSISPIFPPAFLYENEMKDLFGVKIKHISVDYEGNLYRTAIKTPFNIKSVTEE